jgi:hypothetical protein
MQREFGRPVTAESIHAGIRPHVGAVSGY